MSHPRDAAHSPHITQHHISAFLQRDCGHISTSLHTFYTLQCSLAMTWARCWEITYTCAGQEDVRGYTTSPTIARRAKLLHNISVSNVAWEVQEGEWVTKGIHDAVKEAEKGRGGEKDA
jgi:hypothetical protein